jgi:hypothetical protein
MVIRLPKILTKKRNELAHERAQLEVRMAELQEQLRAIDYTIRIIDPAWRAPKKAHKPVQSRGKRAGIPVLST